MSDIDKSCKYLNWDDRKYHNIMVFKNLTTADDLLSDTVIDPKAGFPTYIEIKNNEWDITHVITIKTKNILHLYCWIQSFWS